MEYISGYSNEKLHTHITGVAQSGADGPVKLFEVDTPKEAVKILKKALKASETMTIHGNTVRSNGRSFRGILSKGTRVTVRVSGYGYRYQILHLDRFGIRSVYAIPITQASKLTGLPDLDLSTDELDLLQQMANELESCSTPEELLIEVKHPARETVREQKEIWVQMGEGGNCEILEEVVQEYEFIPDIAVAALDCQLRAFKSFKTAPTGVYNIVEPKKGDAQGFLLPLLGAMTFSNEQGRVSFDEIIIHLKDSDDLNRWRKCRGRMVVIRTSTGSLLWPLIEEIEKQEQVIKSGGPLPTVQLPTIPISVTRSFLQVPYAVDIGLPALEKFPELNGSQLDCLRSAMGRVLNEDTAKRVKADWKKAKALPSFYRESGFETWRKILLKHLLAAWFPEKNTEGIFLSVTQRQEEDRRRREEILQQAFHMLAHTENYENQIVDRPSSKDEAIKLLSAKAVAFWFEPKKGDDKGKKLLAFSRDSLNRLLQSVNVQEEYYDAFIRLCDQEGILDKPNRSITLGGETFTAVTFWFDKG